MCLKLSIACLSAWELLRRHPRCSVPHSWPTDVVQRVYSKQVAVQLHTGISICSVGINQSLYQEQIMSRELGQQPILEETDSFLEMLCTFVRQVVSSVCCGLLHACMHAYTCAVFHPLQWSGLLPTFLSPSQPIGRDLPQWSAETAALPSFCLFSWAGHPHGKSPKVAAGQGCVIDRWHNWLEAGLEWPYANEGLLPEVCLQGQSIEQGLLDWHPCRHPDNIFSFFIPASNNPEPISND